MKYPASTDLQARKRLRNNAGKLVSSLDVAPTLADLFGATPASGLRYEGTSLLQTVPKNRTIFSTATNQWRRWPKGAVAVARGRNRLLCDDSGPCRRGLADGADITNLREVGLNDELADAALRNRVMRGALAGIYRDRYQ